MPERLQRQSENRSGKPLTDKVANTADEMALPSGKRQNHTAVN